MQARHWRQKERLQKASILKYLKVAKKQSKKLNWKKGLLIKNNASSFSAIYNFDLVFNLKREGSFGRYFSQGYKKNTQKITVTVIRKQELYTNVKKMRRC